jgi:hypothetical protein
LSALLVTTTEGFLLDDTLYQAYRATNYHVHAPSPFTLRIGASNSACDALLAAQGAEGAAFLTAWNPFSQPLPDADNILAQARLAADLDILCTAILPGEGTGEIGDWPPEPSLFAVGISQADATYLARKYRQNAFVWITRGQPAQLVICV